MTEKQMEQMRLIHIWYIACQKGDFEQADRIYEQYLELLNGTS